MQEYIALSLSRSDLRSVGQYGKGCGQYIPALTSLSVNKSISLFFTFVSVQCIFTIILIQRLLSKDQTVWFQQIKESRWFQVMRIPRKDGQCLAVIYSNIVALNNRIFTRYLRKHPSEKINTKKLPEKLFRCLREPCNVSLLVRSRLLSAVFWLVGDIFWSFPEITW